MITSHQNGAIKVDDLCSHLDRMALDQPHPTCHWVRQGWFNANLVVCAYP